MPIKVSDLESRDGRSSLLTTDEMLVIDQENNELYTMNVREFRGSSIFISETAPTDTPEDTTNFPEYMTGDTFYYVSSEGIVVYSWDDDNNLWEEQGYASGNRIWTSEELTDDSDDSLNTSLESSYTNDLCFTGDLFFNPDRETLYGPYDSDTGFDFSGEDLDKRSFTRGSKQTIVVADDDYTGDFTSLDDVFTDVTDNNNSLYSPKVGDTIWWKKGGDNGHGGFVYTFTLADYNSATGTHIENVQTAFEANMEYYRSAHLVAVESQPSQDNNEYRAGDSVVDSDNSVLYGTYVESYDTDTTLDIGDLFESASSLKGKDIKYTETDPEQNDTDYVDGDFIFSNSMNTPRIHGPYEFGAASTWEAWPLYTVLRAPIKHEHLYTDTLTTSFDTQTYPTDSTSGTMIVDGDTWMMVYTTDLDTVDEDTKYVEYTVGVTVDYDNYTLDWGDSAANARPPKFWKGSDDTAPSQDDLTYYEGDFYITADGVVYGGYVEGAADDDAAWPTFTSLTAVNTLYIYDADTTYTPDVNNESSDWGGDIVYEGDILKVYYTGSTTGKVKTYLCTDIDSDSGDAITWELQSSESITHTYSAYTYPVLNDADYTEGDYIVNKSGIKYGPYVEEASDDATAWPYFSTTRGSINIYVDHDYSNGNPVTPTTSSDAGLYISGLIFAEGDTIHYVSNVEGDITTKTKSAYITDIDYDNDTSTWSDLQNDQGTFTHDSTDTDTPALDDTLYSEGDFIINANAVLYGPYVELQTEDTSAWPAKSSLRDNIGVIVDTGSVDAGTNWKLVVENGILQIESFDE